jgi:cytochrome c-type biogenesis protein
MLGIIKLDFLFAEKRLHIKKISVRYFSSFLLGMGFAFGWSPCVGPLLAGILLYASQENQVGKGIFLLSVYSFGLAVPFLLTALSVNYFFAGFNKIKKHMRMIEVLSGLLLIFLGVLIFFGKLSVLISWIPFANKLSL